METEASEQRDAASHEEAIQQSRGHRWNRRVALIAGLAALVAAAVVLPPLINMGRYQRQITAVMSRSLGRPVRISGVGLRLLPRPGFILHDLSVGEDPGFGVEPVLSARTVIAAIHIPSLWRGQLTVDRVSVDEASLNLVRSAQGLWNLDSLLIGAKAGQQSGNSGSSGGLVRRSSSAHFPYLEATDSRVNLKNGVEKSPYSLTGADLSLWQDSPGQWRVRLKGQPVRTDMEMSAADTGELRMEASLRSAPQLRDMPLQMQMEWRDAQLGQLSRLLFGSDAGWRGDLTADIDVRGTADNAQTKARLRATGVRREEFTPETPLDFDANCAFRYQHSQNALHDIGCDTALGDGRLHLKADLPGNGGSPEAMLEVSQVPLQAGLDLLRTVRSGFAPGISLKGNANGSLTYHVIENPAPKKLPAAKTGRKPAQTIAPPANLQGTLTVEGAQIKGGGLKEALSLPRMTLTPASIPSFDTAENSIGLGTRFTVALSPVAAAASKPAARPNPTPATGQPDAQAASQTSAQAISPAAPQTLNVRLGLGARGYDAAVSGSANLASIRDLAYAFGLPHLDAADGFSGPAAEVDFAARGPWLDSGEVPVPPATPAAPPSPAEHQKKSAATPPPPVGTQFLTASLTMRRAQWQAAYLAQPVHLTQAVFTLSPVQIAFNSNFSLSSGDDSGKDSSAATSKNSAQDAGQAPNTALKQEPKADKGKADGTGQDQSGQNKVESGKTGSDKAGSNKAGSNETEPDESGLGKVGSGMAGNSVSGTVSIHVSPNCKPGEPGQLPDACLPQVQLRLGAVDAAKMQAALLGAPRQKGIFAPLLDRMRSSDRPKWPDAVVSVQADSLVLGSATLQKPVLQMRFKPAQVEIQSWQTDLLGGSAKGTGSFAWTSDKPEYTFAGDFTRIDPAALGKLLEAQWSGGQMSGSGSVQLSGLAAKDLAASAVGDLRFDWLHGTLSATSAEGTQPTKFDDWSGTAKIQSGQAQLGENAMLAGKRSSTMTGAIVFGAPAKLALAPAEGKLAAQAAKPAASAK